MSHYDEYTLPLTQPMLGCRMLFMGFMRPEFAAFHICLAAAPGFGGSSLDAVCTGLLSVESRHGGKLLAG